MALTVKIGDVYGLTYVASVATNWSATLKVRNRHGVVRKYAYRETAATSDRTAQSRTSERISEDGEIVGFACATGSVVAVKRGQFYLNVFVLGDSASGDVEVNVAKGYVYAGKSLALGDSVEPGPGGGEGFRSGTTIADDVAGNSQTDTVLAVANTIRRYHSFSILYNASGDAATRTLALSLVSPITTSGPTGFILEKKIWQSADITMIASEEGILYIDQTGQFVSFNDNGTLTYADNTTAPVPFPRTITEGVSDSLNTEIGSGHANDRYSIFADVEEWLVL